MKDIFWIVIEIIVFSVLGYFISISIGWIFSISKEYYYPLGYSLTYILFLFFIANNLRYWENRNK
jgi:NhaP-type Na+/H+ or K+/H+ antiporter